MIHTALLWLIATFVIDPAMAGVGERLREARAPQAVIEQVSSCALTAPGALAERAAGDWWWGASTLFGVAVGMADPATVIASATPGCASAVNAMRPWLRAGETT